MGRLSPLFCIAVASLFILTGCDRGKLKVTPPPVATLPWAYPMAGEVTDYIEYNGRTKSKDEVAIQPRVTGNLVAMPFKEGSEVKQGDILFEVDPAPYKAQYDAAKAQVELNQAGLE